MIMAATSSSGTSTQHYGPYASGSGDSGTCGPDWATDTFDRHFTVFQNNNDGSLLVVEQFKAGSFVTTAGPSPGARPNGLTDATLGGGGHGSMEGQFGIPPPSRTIQNSSGSSC